MTVQRCLRLLRSLVRGAIATLLLHSPADLLAKSPPSSAAEHEIARCIRQSAGGKLWLEKTLWGLRDQEGGWIGAEIANKDGSHDLGPLQVNSWWVPRIAGLIGRTPDQIRLWLRHDACFNVDAARWIFLSALAETRNYWEAIGAYHSPTRWRRQRYSASVAKRLARRFGPQIFHAHIQK